MRRGLFGAVAVAAVLGSAAMPAAARAAGQVSSANGSGEVKAISCGSGGTCAAGGDYFDASSKNQQAFVVTEIGGKWGAGVEVPGLAADNSKTSTITAISCAAGACTAGGWWQGAKLVFHAFVTTERNGKWSRLTSVLTAKRAAPHITGVRSVSCAGPKNCTVSGGRPAFMASEVNGKWGKAVEFPRHDKNGNVVVSCAAAGNCTAGWGNFVASDKHGRWGALRGVPNVTALGKEVSISSVSCTSTVNCAVAGIDRAGARDMVFVARETNGRWGKAIQLPGFSSLQKANFADVASISCIQTSDCAVGGDYNQPADFAGGVYEPFVASETNGRWGSATTVPGIPLPGNTECEPDSNHCDTGQVLSVSCSSGGICAAGGWYDTQQGDKGGAFVVLYRNGRWGQVTAIPGLDASGNGFDAQVSAGSWRHPEWPAAGRSSERSEPWRARRLRVRSRWPAVGRSPRGR